MKLDLTPVSSTYAAPTFGGDDNAPLDPNLKRRLERPMIIGGLIILVLIIGLGLWASFSELSTGITAPGEARVEANRKSLRHRDLATVRQIFVKEGQHVRAGQPLITYNEVEARATYDVMRNQVDSLEAQAARLAAESTGRTTLDFPADLTARMADPRVAGMIRDQQFLFTSRYQLFQSQMGVLGQRLDQLQTQIEGQQAQVDSVNEQARLTDEELAGYKTLFDKGYAPKTLILRYERSLADLNGRKGSLMADIAKLRQQIGETRMQMNANRDQRQSQAAESLRDTQAKYADTLPRLTAAREALNGTVKRSPVDGYVFNLTQFTVGGVTAPGELLMDIVPADAPLMVTALIKPEDVDDVHVGMKARVRLTGLTARWHDPLDAKVVVVSADRFDNEKTGQSAYRVDLRIDPQELTKLKHGTRITPGMPAQAMIVTGSRSVMGSLISPITDTLHQALRDQ